MPVSASARCHSPSLCSSRLRVAASAGGHASFRAWPLAGLPEMRSAQLTSALRKSPAIEALSMARVPYGIFDARSAELWWDEPARALTSRREQRDVASFLAAISAGSMALHACAPAEALEPSCLPRLRLAISAHPDRPSCSVVVLVPRFAVPDPAGLERLSQRERTVAELIAEGESTKGIASRLGISEHTVRRHTEHLFSKLGVRSRAAVASLVAGNVV